MTLIVLRRQIGLTLLALAVCVAWHTGASARPLSVGFLTRHIGEGSTDERTASYVCGTRSQRRSTRQSLVMFAGIRFHIPNPFQFVQLTMPKLPSEVGEYLEGWERVSHALREKVDIDGTVRDTGKNDAAILAASAAGAVKSSGWLVAKRKKRIMILISDTGGGHRASAQALQQALDDLFPGQIECNIVDIWTDYASWPFNTFVPAYKWLAKNPAAWRAFWEYGRFPLTKWSTELLSNIVCHESFRECIEQFGPDMVVSVHPLCQDVPLRVLKQMGKGKREIPFATVVTDLGGAHPTWFNKEADVCFVPSEAVRKLALGEGLRPDQIRLHGLPVRPGFWKEARDKISLRKQLGLHLGVKTVLVMGGGDGIGKLDKIAYSLAENLSHNVEESQMVVVCGKNEKMRSQLEGHQWPSNVHVVICGFVENMDNWMGACDCIVTKAGPGTIAESMTRGLPMVLSSFLPGQEAGNVPYVVEGGFGAFTKKPRLISQTVADWFGNDSKLQSMSVRAKQQARPDATYAIARDIGDMVFGSSSPAHGLTFEFGPSSHPSSRISLASKTRKRVPVRVM